MQKYTCMYVINFIEALTHARHCRIGLRKLRDPSVRPTHVFVAVSIQGHIALVTVGAAFVDEVVMATLKGAVGDGRGASAVEFC